MNFEIPSSVETKISREIEKIEMAHAKLAVKYEGHADCLAFVDFLKTTERVFAEAKYRNWSTGKSKEELVKLEIGLVSERSGLSSDMLNSINDDFKNNCVSVGKICDIADQLLEKYKNEEDCFEFILYLKDVYIGVHNVRRNQMEMMDLKTGLIQARMQALSSDGNPQFKLLEDIYSEFKNNLA